jgi:transmembrane sensor
MKGAFCPMGQIMIDPDILDAAADWHAQLEGDAADYDGFVIWLEADARHRDAYDRVIALDTLVTDHAPGLASSLPANDDASPVTGSRWRWAGLAASLALLAYTGAVTLGGGFGQIDIETQRGETRRIQLADASAVTLDGNSAISYGKDNARAIILASGSAHFDVKHDAAKPFSVAAGGYSIRDLGTEFTVSHNQNLVSISVSQGLIDVSGPGMTRLALHPGERLDIADGKFETSRIDPASVGSWRQGRLTYSNTPLRLVVADINRYAAQPVQLDPALSDRRFSGVLTIGDGSQLAPTLANVMALPLVPGGAVVRIGAGSAR